ncbi:MAG: FlgD immunoglobulin-like domain containing protein [Ignavibacteriaceae bacterium]
MTKRIFIIVLPLAAFIFAFLFFAKSYNKQQRENDEGSISNVKENEELETGYAAEAAKWYYDQRAFPLGYIPNDWRDKAFKHIAAFNQPNFLAKTAAQSLSWTQLGPGNIGGRVRAIVVSPSDPNTVYIGSVSGGIWKTTNGGTSWFPLDDHMNNLAVCSMVMDPKNPNIIYAGTGEGFNNYDALQGAGIFRTTDAGATWAQLSLTNNKNFYFVNRLAIDSTTGALYAATLYGLFKSTDGGNSFSTAIPSNYGQQGNMGSCVDVVISYTNPTTIYASFGLFIHSQIWRSIDGGSTFSYNYSSPHTGRIELAASPSNPSVAYASFMDSTTNEIGYMAATIDGGKSWNKILIPGPNSEGTSSYTANQGWYNNALTVDPDSASILYAAGIDTWKMTNTGLAFTQITNAYARPSSLPGVHADIHTMVFAPSNHQVIYLGCDGGVYKSTNRGADWTAINNSLFITQFYSGAVAPTGTIYYGGTQDNYTLKSTGTTFWSKILGGDGGDVNVDYNNPNNVYAEFPNFSFVKSTNGQNFVYAQNGLPVNSTTHETTDRTLFITPVSMDPNNPQTLVAGTYRVWLATGGASQWTAISGDLTNDGTGSQGNDISAVTVANGNSNIIYAGCTNGKVWITQNANAGTNASWQEIDSGLPQAWCTRLVTDPNNQGIVYATFSGYLAGYKVYKSTNYGNKWTNISGDLPNIPVNCLVVNPYIPGNLYIGTDLGIFSTTNGGTSWVQDNNGLANVSVFDLDYRSSGNIMFAATHGRGMFSAVLPIGTGPIQLSYDSDTTTVGWAWSKGVASANRITPPMPGMKLINMSIYFIGVQSGNATYTPLILQSNGLQPGSNFVTLPSKTAVNIPGWDVTDLSTDGIIVNGDFYVGLIYDGTNKPEFGYSNSSNGRAWNNAGGGWASWGQTYYMRATVQAVTSVSEVDSKIPSTFRVYQNYPNPFNPTTTIQYALPEARSVKIIVYDINGKEVTVLANNFQNAGTYSVTWNGKSDNGQQVASGIYFYRVQAGNYVQTNKMVLLK